MRVLLTGGTGFVGGEILRQLKQVGHSVRMVVRNRRSRKAQGTVSQNKVEICTGDVLDPASLAPALTGSDSVIHLVGIISEAGENTFENIHTRGTENIVAASRRAGIRRFIHMSALGTRPNAISRYHKSKWAAEEIVRQSGLAHTIFRPSLIYGPGDHFVNLFAKIIRLSPIVPVMASPHARFQPVPIESVATAFIKALAEPRAIGQTYDLCGLEAFTLSEIIDQVLLAMGRKRLKLRIPPGIARFQAAFLEFLFAGLLRKPPPLNREQLVMLQEDNLGEPSAANGTFGLNPIPFREGITKYLDPARV